MQSEDFLNLRRCYGSHLHSSDRENREMAGGFFSGRARKWAAQCAFFEGPPTGAPPSLLANFVMQRSLRAGFSSKSFVLRNHFCKVVRRLQLSAFPQTVDGER